MSGGATAGCAAAGGGAAGLVRSETSHLPDASQVVAQLEHERRRFGRMRRCLLTAGRLMVDSWRGTRARWWMVTLTYRDDVEWRAGDITGCTNRIRDWLARRGAKARYVWCLETTQRGRPHYHVLLQLPFGLTMPKPDKQGWWKHGLTRTEVARRAVGYLAKYASKAGSVLDQFKGARCYGVSGLQANHRAVLSFWRAPRWVRTAARFCDADGSLPETEVSLPVRRVRGGWTWLQTGEFWQSPVIAQWLGGVLCFLPRPEAAC